MLIILSCYKYIMVIFSQSFLLNKENKMNKVEPIRDKNKIKDIKNILKKKNDRNYMLFVLGINTGLRIGDLLKLKVKDVKNKSHIIIKEQKTSKFKQFLINSNLRAELNKYI